VPTIWLCLVAGLSVLALACAGASWGGNGYDAAADMNSMYSTTLYSGAQAWWKAGYTGKGVDVAVIDTGVSPVAGLDAPGKLIHGPDLSLESQAPNLTNLDTSGHGTFIAGLIAGRDAGLNTPYTTAPPSAYRGMAPDARILSLKVGTADGGVDVSQVIAAIDWVVEHRHDRGLDIRVLNLSYGTNSAQSAEVDPLSYAVEQAWKRGIVVVAAAGNSGYQVGGGAPGVADPAYNPFVIAAGGSDSIGTPALADDTVGPIRRARAAAPASGPTSSRRAAPGPPRAGLVHRPDRAAGRDQRTLLSGHRDERGGGDRLRRGRSSSTGTRAGSDDVKAFFKQNAVTCRARAASRGVGRDRPRRDAGHQPPRTATTAPGGDGYRPAEVARNQDHLTRDGVVLSGEQDIFGKPFDSAEMARLEAASCGRAASGTAAPGPAAQLKAGNGWSGRASRAAPGPGTAGLATAGAGTAGLATAGLVTAGQEQLVGRAGRRRSWAPAEEVAPPVRAALPSR
jgi:serine protease AprX